MNFLKSRRTRIIFIVSAVALVAAGLIAVLFYLNTKESTLTATVCYTESVPVTNSAGEVVNQYRVGVNDGRIDRTYIVEDYAFGKNAPRFHSADFYAKLRHGTTYDIVALGIRLPDLFPNIAQAEVSSEQHPEYCEN